MSVVTVEELRQVPNMQYWLFGCLSVYAVFMTTIFGMIAWCLVPFAWSFLFTLHMGWYLVENTTDGETTDARLERGEEIKRNSGFYKWRNEVISGPYEGEGLRLLRMDLEGD